MLWRGFCLKQEHTTVCFLVNDSELPLLFLSHFITSMWVQFYHLRREVLHPLSQGDCWVYIFRKYTRSRQRQKKKIHWLLLLLHLDFNIRKLTASCQVMHAHVSGATVKQRVAGDCCPAGLARRIKTLVGNKGEVKDQISHTDAQTVLTVAQIRHHLITPRWSKVWKAFCPNPPTPATHTCPTACFSLR